ncbi:hypothetical protein HO133_001890 [Letharia lupina]|uniref:Uncharacterized protein n=1 Tax=Letharia lupina TaxID=560253 RepID=A0A8H6CED3_9LECA|nr:uncharacterized protein HO133_001890 [Letharia lupina]KAF6221922.1 hypothetical protein HO133_001890 [Letharia lupina]
MTSPSPESTAVTEGITTPHTNIDDIEDTNLEQKIAHIRAKYPLRSTRECEEALQLVNNDVDKTLAFLAYLVPRIPGIQT